MTLEVKESRIGRFIPKKIPNNPENADNPKIHEKTVTQKSGKETILVAIELYIFWGHYLNIIFIFHKKKQCNLTGFSGLMRFSFGQNLSILLFPGHPNPKTMVSFNYWFRRLFNVNLSNEWQLLSKLTEI